jgi:hypothetical protein
MATVDLTIQQGTTWTQQLEYQDGDGDPIDLSAAELRAQIRPDVADRSATVLLDIASGDGITADDQGLITLTADADTTEALPIGSYRWDLESVEAGVVSRICAGSVRVTGEVTREVAS